MLALPADVLPLLTRSSKVTARLLGSVNGSGFTYPVQLEDGAVRVDASSPIRRRLSCTVAADIDDPEVDVFRTELRAEYGIVRLNGQVHWVPVGTFVVTGAKEAGRGRVEVEAEDRWRRIVNARFLVPVTTSGSTVTAITNLLTGADSRITVVDETGSAATHPAAMWERDRDQAVLDLAKSIGAVVVFDPDGVARIRKVGSLSDPTVWRVYGGAGGALVDSRRGATQDSTYNAAVVNGEPPDKPPVRAVALLTKASSPIVFGGPFARRPRFYTSPLITTTAQAQAAANALLARVSGMARTVTVDAAPHPGLDGGDVIEVQVTPEITERHIVDSFSLPLGPGGVQIATRTTADQEPE